MRNKVLPAVLAAVLAVSACSGPVTYGENGMEWEPTLATNNGPVSSDRGLIIPLIILAVAVAALSSDSDSD